MIEKISFTLNGKPVQVTDDSDRKLLWVLRTELELTGTKYGCGLGLCGSCTVVLDNKSVRSCQLPLKSVQGKHVTTIEGLEVKGKLHPVQKAFMEHNAFQCGYCTSGQIMEAYSYLLNNPNPTYADIVDNMEGNLCRCGSYNRIVQAIQSAAREMKGVSKWPTIIYSST